MSREMRFAYEHVEALLDGEKTTTVRLGDEWAALDTGESLDLLDEDGEHIGTATVGGIGDMTLAASFDYVQSDDGHRSYRTRGQYFDRMARYYRDLDLRPDMTAYVVILRDVTDERPHPRARSDGGVPDDSFEGLRFEPGDLLVDDDADPADRGSVVVLRYPRQDDGEPVMAANQYIDGHDTTVADVNPGYDPGEWTVEVAFEGWLDSAVSEWRGLLADAADEDLPLSFYDLLADYCTEWDVPKRTYSYPEGRLVPRRYCPDHEVRGEWFPGFPEAGEPPGYACPIPACGYGTLPGNETALHALDERDAEEPTSETNRGP